MERYARRRAALGSELRRAREGRKALEHQVRLMGQRGGQLLNSQQYAQHLDNLDAQLERAKKAEERAAGALQSSSLSGQFCGCLRFFSFCLIAFHFSGPPAPAMKPLPSPRLPPLGDAFSSRRVSFASSSSSDTSDTSPDHFYDDSSPSRTSRCLVTSHNSMPGASVEQVEIITARGRGLLDLKERLRDSGERLEADAVLGVQTRWLSAASGLVEGRGVAVKLARPRCRG